MAKVKIISEPSELVPLLLALATPMKREILNELMKDWSTEKSIISNYGEDAYKILKFFEKHKLVETLWQPDSAHKRTKAYRAYYNSVHINVACSLEELSLALKMVMQKEEEFKVLEEKIFELVGKEGLYFGDVMEAMEDLSPIEFTSVIRRSTRLEHRGHRVKKIE